MNIQQWWPTPVFMETAPFPKETLESLSKLVQWQWREGQTISHPLPSVPNQTFRPTHNFFAQDIPAEFIPAVTQLKSFIKPLYIEYLKRSYGVSGIADLKIDARCFGDLQTKGERTFPHYHHTCDHVFVMYLHCGENRPTSMAVDRKGDGELLLLDPRHFSTFPFWDKVKQVRTFEGLMLLHPASVWHETKTMNADGERTLVVVTLRTRSHNYTDAYCEI